MKLITTWVRKMSMSESDLRLPTTAVVVGQVAFMLFAYAHALWSGELDMARFHISAVLDHDWRSVACAWIGVYALLTLVILEHRRFIAGESKPTRALRIGLATSCGVGIILCCTVRESSYLVSHRLAAAFGFGSAVLLVLVIALVSGVGRAAAATLCVFLAVTGACQGAHIVGTWHGLQLLPSWTLGCLEIVLVLGFGTCMSACRCAGASTRGRDSPVNVI